MTRGSKLVNLDAMIERSDFALEETDNSHVEKIQNISVRDFTEGALVGPSLRKPDFQRETNHWSADQVVSLLECYVNGELIPSVILWMSTSHLFVIDGGHRLSVIKAWITDDYGDGPISQSYFGYEISKEQKRIANNTRLLINEKVGSWKHLQAKQNQPGVSAEEKRKINTIISRALPIQWVTGDADKAENSFFRINSMGTPLDEIEELLLKSRRKPIAIASRAVIRSGKGHRYWSAFDPTHTKQIEEKSKTLHSVLFEPEISSPVKTLDLPLGGSKGIRTALQVLIEFMLIASRNQNGNPVNVDEQEDDADGSATVGTLERSLKLANKITGNDKGSLGLHPAVYFYGPTGRHSGAMFMGTVALLGKILSNNDKAFFAKFTSVREQVEKSLIENKDLIATILQKHVSKRRTEIYSKTLALLIDMLHSGKVPHEDWYIEVSELKGKILSGTATSSQVDFTDEVKNEAFINVALRSAMKCPICNGYLDPTKSISYDHVDPKRGGGKGGVDNLQMVHPYCNQSVKS